MTAAIMECLNPECGQPKPYGFQDELPDTIDPSMAYDAAQTDWPLCDCCLEPLALAELVQVDQEMLLCLVQEVFELYNMEGILQLRDVCARMIVEAAHQPA